MGNEMGNEIWKRLFCREILAQRGFLGRGLKGCFPHCVPHFASHFVPHFVRGLKEFCSSLCSSFCTRVERILFLILFKISEQEPQGL